MSGVENQYRSNANDVVIQDYQATAVSPYQLLGPISTYYLDYGNQGGRSLVMGLFTDILQSNANFQAFFNSVFRTYGIDRSTAPFTGPTFKHVPDNETIIPPPEQEGKRKIEEKATLH